MEGGGGGGGGGLLYLNHGQKSKARIRHVTCAFNLGFGPPRAITQVRAVRPGPSHRWGRSAPGHHTGGRGPPRAITQGGPCHAATDGTSGVP